MMTRSPLTLGLTAALAACAGPTDGPPDDGPAQGDRHQVAVLTTASASFDAGLLTIVSLDDLTAEDVATVHPDAGVRAEGGAVWHVERLQVDVVRRYTPGQWSAPVWEASVGTGANPYDVALCGDRLFVSRYEEATLTALDAATGDPVGEVDLSAWADDDGIPEAADLRVLDGRLFVGLQRLDRLDGWTSAPGGRLVEVDCDGLTGVEAWETGPNPTLTSVPGGVAVLADDGVRIFDGVSVSEPVLTDVGGARVVELAVGDDGRGVLVAGDGSTHTVACVDVGDWTVQEVTTLERYIPDAAVNDRGEAWVALRAAWGDPEAPGGLMIVDVAACEDLTADGWVTPTLPPYGITFY